MCLLCLCIFYQILVRYSRMIKGDVRVQRMWYHVQSDTGVSLRDPSGAASGAVPPSPPVSPPPSNASIAPPSPPPTTLGVSSTLSTKPVAPLSPPPAAVVGAAVVGAAAIGATSGLKSPAPPPVAPKPSEAQLEPWQDFATGDFHEVLYTEKHQKV